MNISKELLSEVLGKEVAQDNNIQIATPIVHYSNITHMSSINIYELAHKCKEWAWDNGYTIKSYKSDEDWWAMIRNMYINTTTEPEAIFKACEWILEQKDKHE